jgi:hypothetical protein
LRHSSYYLGAVLLDDRMFDAGTSVDCEAAGLRETATGLRETATGLDQLSRIRRILYQVQRRNKMQSKMLSLHFILFQNPLCSDST